MFQQPKHIFENSRAINDIDYNFEGCNARKSQHIPIVLDEMIAKKQDDRKYNKFYYVFDFFMTDFMQKAFSIVFKKKLKKKKKKKKKKNRV